MIILLPKSYVRKDKDGNIEAEIIDGILYIYRVSSFKDIMIEPVGGGGDDANVGEQFGVEWCSYDEYDGTTNHFVEQHGAAGFAGRGLDTFAVDAEKCVDE